MFVPRRRSRGTLWRLAAVTAAATVLIGWGASADERDSLADQITAVTLIHGIPGKERDLKEHLLSLAGPTRAETGCITYDLYQSPGQPHEFMRFEVWKSLGALETHKKTAHLKASFEKRQREGWTTQIMVFQRVSESAATAERGSE